MVLIVEKVVFVGYGRIKLIDQVVGSVFNLFLAFFFWLRLRWGGILLAKKTKKGS